MAPERSAAGARLRIASTASRSTATTASTCSPPPTAPSSWSTSTAAASSSSRSPPTARRRSSRRAKRRCRFRSAGTTSRIHDADTKQFAIYHFLQSAAARRRARGARRAEAGRGRLAQVAPSASSPATASTPPAERDGQYNRIAESKDSRGLSFEVDPLKAFTHYRVSAVTRLDVEGEPTAPVEDLFRAAFRQFEGGKYDAAAHRLRARGQEPRPSIRRTIEYLGRTLLALGKHEAALARFQDLGAAGPATRSLGRQLEARALAAGGDILGARAGGRARHRHGQRRHGDLSRSCADFSLRARRSRRARCAAPTPRSSASRPMPTRAPCAAKR